MLLTLSPTQTHCQSSTANTSLNNGTASTRGTQKHMLLRHPSSRPMAQPFACSSHLVRNPRSSTSTSRKWHTRTFGGTSLLIRPMPGMQFSMCCWSCGQAACKLQLCHAMAHCHRRHGPWHRHADPTHWPAGACALLAQLVCSAVLASFAILLSCNQMHNARLTPLVPERQVLHVLGPHTLLTALLA